MQSASWCDAPFGHHTFSFFAPAEAVSSFFAREDSQPHFLFCFFSHMYYVQLCDIICECSHCESKHRHVTKMPQQDVHVWYNLSGRNQKWDKQVATCNTAGGHRSYIACMFVRGQKFASTFQNVPSQTAQKLQIWTQTMQIT